MDSTSLTEQREELMVSSLTNHNNKPIIKTSHFLKPTTITEPNLPPASSLTIKPPTLSVSFRGWRLPNKNFKFWASKMETLHKPTWIKAGIFEAIISSTYKVYKNQSLILSLAQKWSPETKAFVFPWGEVTLTLEDVNVLMGFSVSGSSVLASLTSLEMEKTVKRLKEYRDESSNKKQCSWTSRFEDSEIEHEAFLVLWLSNYVFPDKNGCSIMQRVFPIAVRLAKGERIALAPAVLASLYNDLDVISGLECTQKLSGLFQLVQVWIWERFKSVRPEGRMIRIDEPRIAQWSGVKQRSEGLVVLDGFEWRPYTKPLEDWCPPRFYGEEGRTITLDDDDSEFVSFARCVRVSKLVGFGVVEDYYPNRVAMQFGFSQDIPVLVTTTHQNRKFTEKEAWDDYNQSLCGFKLYVPSRHATGSVTARYRDWWIKPVPKIQKEAFNAIDTADHYDDDVTPKTLPLSQVLEKLGDGTTEKVEDLANNGYKRARVCRQVQTEEGDGNITIARKMKTRKKYTDDVAKPVGGSSRLEADKSPMECFGTPKKKCSDDVEKHEGDYYNVSVLREKFASRDGNVGRTKSVVLSSELHVASNRVAEKAEQDTDERLMQRKARIEEIALKLEARISKVGNILAKIKQWKLKRINTKTQVLA